MALRFERRHLPFRTWYHKRYEGGKGAETAPCCFLLLQGGDFLLLQDGCLELLSCEAPPTECCLELASDGCLELAAGGALELANCGPFTPGCAILPDSGIIETPVTWDAGLFFNAVQVVDTIHADWNIDFNQNPNGFAGTVDNFTDNGFGFSFQLGDFENWTGNFSFGLGPLDNDPPIDCGDNDVVVGNACRWRTVPQFPYYSFVGPPHAAYIQAENGGNFEFVDSFDHDTVFTIIRCNDHICMYVDNVLLSTSPLPFPYATARFNVFTENCATPVDLVRNVKFLSNITCGA